MKQLRHLIIKTAPMTGPLAIAVLVHAAWIGFDAKAEHEKRSDISNTQNNEHIDNTVQLIRLTRLSSQGGMRQSTGLDLSSTLPPPPPELKGTTEQKAPIETNQDCGARENQQTENQSNGSLATNQAPNPVGSPKNLGGQSKTTTREGGKPEEQPPLNPESIKEIWRKAMGVPIWPTDLGERDQSVELKELSLAFFNGMAADDLNGLEILTTSHRYKIKVFNDRVFILKDQYTEKNGETS